LPRSTAGLFSRSVLQSNAHAVRPESVCFGKVDCRTRAASLAQTLRSGWFLGPAHQGSPTALPLGHWCSSAHTWRISRRIARLRKLARRCAPCAPASSWPHLCEVEKVACIIIFVFRAAEMDCKPMIGPSLRPRTHDGQLSLPPAAVEAFRRESQDPALPGPLQPLAPFARVNKQAVPPCTLVQRIRCK